ncbi:MAG: redox-regulated ATPase YchF [Candidatus Aminicenantes bacterium]|nr:redox-regulated ATPase YchF [Candidatus Aminicenantes bacterium]
MNLTIFGYPKTGKTTLFNLISGARIEVHAYEDGKREPNQRTCAIPDFRLDRIAALHPDKKKVAASFELIDLAGVSFGEVKNSLYLSALRKADALLHVVRGFRDPQIAHPKGRIMPEEDIRYMEEELMLTDLIAATARLEKLEKDLRKIKDPEAEKEKAALAAVREGLEQGKPVRALNLPPVEEKWVRSFAFLSQKPLLHMVNCDERDIPFLDTPDKLLAGPRTASPVLAFCGRIEAEIAELEGEEKEAFLAEYGLGEPSTSRFFKELPRVLGMISFFTIGKDETRAWMIPRGAAASQAAGVIHSDIERGFIRAEVVAWDTLLEIGSLQAAKDKGAVRLEGKDYPVQDGDVIYFRFTS